MAAAVSGVRNETGRERGAYLRHCNNGKVTGGKSGIPKSDDEDASCEDKESQKEWPCIDDHRALEYGCGIRGNQ